MRAAAISQSKPKVMRMHAVSKVGTLACSANLQQLQQQMLLWLRLGGHGLPFAAGCGLDGVETRRLPLHSSLARVMQQLGLACSGLQACFRSLTSADQADCCNNTKADCSNTNGVALQVTDL